MRTLTLFALSLAGVALLADDAQAFGKRRGNGCNGGCYGGGYGCAGYVSHGCSGYSHGCSGGTLHSASGGWSGHAATVTTSGTGIASTFSGNPGVVRGTDGQTYVLGSDGKYYAGSGGITSSGFVTRPYPTSVINAYPGPYPWTYSTAPGTYTYPGMWRGSTVYYPSSSGIFPASYSTPYYGSGVVPAGGPLTMPGVTVGPGGITIVPNVLPPRR